VELTDRVALGCRYENLRGLRADLTVAGVAVRHMNHGDEDEDGWEVRAGIGFRI